MIVILGGVFFYSGTGSMTRQESNNNPNSTIAVEIVKDIDLVSNFNITGIVTDYKFKRQLICYLLLC
jgi:hypothetical protein